MSENTSRAASSKNESSMPGSCRDGSPTSGRDYSRLRDLASAATSGPWHWAGNTDSGEPYLATWTPGFGRCQVLAVGYDERSATGRAADEVRATASEYGIDPADAVGDWMLDRHGQPIREPRLEFVTDLLCVNARDLAVYEVAPDATSREDPAVYRADVVGIRHPDAEYIAAVSPDVLLALLDTLDKVRAYAEDRAFHAKGHLNTVNSGRIASDLLTILGVTVDEEAAEAAR